MWTPTRTGSGTKGPVRLSMNVGTERYEESLHHFSSPWLRRRGSLASAFRGLISVRGEATMRHTTVPAVLLAAFMVSCATVPLNASRPLQIDTSGFGTSYRQGSTLCVAGITMSF